MAYSTCDKTAKSIWSSFSAFLRNRPLPWTNALTSVGWYCKTPGETKGCSRDASIAMLKRLDLYATIATAVQIIWIIWCLQNRSRQSLTHRYGCKRAHPRCEAGIVLLMSHIFDGGENLLRRILDRIHSYESVPLSDHRQQTMFAYENNRALFCTLFGRKQVYKPTLQVIQFAGYAALGSQAMLREAPITSVAYRIISAYSWWMAKPRSNQTTAALAVIVTLITGVSKMVMFAWVSRGESFMGILEEHYLFQYRGIDEFHSTAMLKSKTITVFLGTRTNESNTIDFKANVNNDLFPGGL